MAEMARSLMDYAAPPVAQRGVTGSPAQPMSLMDYLSDLDLLNILNGTGIPERLALVNETLNPLAAIPRAQAASQEIFAPDRSIMQRIASTGDMLSEVGGVVVPMAASTRVGVPAATALVEGLLGGSPTTQAASDAARRFLANESGALPLGKPSLAISRQDASNIFGAGSERVRYTDTNSGGTIEVVVRPDGSASVLELEVPEASRGQGIGQTLQARVLHDFPKMGGQVSSKAAATTAYRLGRRPQGNPNATLEDVFAAIDDMSSVNLVSPAMQTTPVQMRQFLADESGAVPLMGGGTAGPTQEAKQAAENAFAAARQAYENNPVNARGAQIIDMLTSGRADEITDEMLDMGDPVLNANLNQYLYRNYDLPMDEASRMERAGQMGFDTGTPLYHGTDKKFQAFNSEKQRDPGFWFTTDSRNAANYADSEGDLLKVFTKTDKETQIPFNEYVLPVVNGNEVDFDDNVQLVKEYLERSGTVTFPNGNFTESGYTRVLDDPRHIRRVEARFDPRLSHLRNLSAGLAPFGLLALQPNEEQY